MPAEPIRCSECGAPLKGIPTWLVSADVKFSCSSCPKRSSRAGIRMEPAIEPRGATAVADPDADPDAIEIEDLDEDSLDGADELEDLGDDTEI